MAGKIKSKNRICYTSIVVLMMIYSFMSYGQVFSIKEFIYYSEIHVDTYTDYKETGTYFNEVEATGNENTIDTKTWMGKISDTVELDDIMLPGSHDAGMSSTEHCSVLAKPSTGYILTQSAEINSQLAYGSRYFDIRIDYDHGELVTYHRTINIGCNGQDLKSVLDQIQDFLKNAPSEAVIVKISHIRSDRGDSLSIKDKIDTLLDDYSQSLFVSKLSDINLARIKLGDVRGKIIFVFDYQEYIDPAKGRFHYKDGYINDACITQSDANLTVCDCYSDTAYYGKMEQDQLAKWDLISTGSGGNFFLLSWTLTPVIPFIDPTIDKLAAEANARLPGVLHEQLVKQSAIKPNVVYIDFMNQATARSIIQYNFTLNQYQE